MPTPDIDSQLTHTQADGTLSMVDVSHKTATHRQAKAEGFISMKASTLQLIQENGLAKGDVLACARIAGIQAAKQTGQLIPLCHPLSLSKVSVEFELLADASKIRILADCKINHVTGVEMEALTAVSIAALTLFDMCKGVDKTMTISDIKVLEKHGGKSGDWTASTV